MLSAGKTYKR